MASASNGTSTNQTAGFPIVAIGASAGGIQALSQFFAQVDEHSGMAYVVILHLSPNHDSKLAELLSQVTPLPVNQLTKKERIRPDRVYVIPPNKHLRMEGEFITASPNLREEDRRAPVDIFFRTLAETHGERAEYNEMPRNAIATDLVDEVLPVAEIPQRLLSFTQNLGKVSIHAEAETKPELQQKALREIFAQLRKRTGHDFTNYKQPTLLRRIDRRISILELPDLAAYATFLQKNADEVSSLLKELLISVTNFFRDKAAFQALEQILSGIVEAKTSDDHLRIWVAGCATGEEAYSIAMLCAEHLAKVLDAPKVQIFATDIDEHAIAIAREGFYTINDTADVSPERLRRFFNKEDSGYQIRREIREMILFANYNFLKDPPFSHLDMVTCRNVLIYFNQAAQQRVMETFHFALNPGGILFLGSSESADRFNELFVSVNREQHIFQAHKRRMRSFSGARITAFLPYRHLQAFSNTFHCWEWWRPHGIQRSPSAPA